LLIVARMNLEDLSARLMKPRYDDDLVSRGDAREAFHEQPVHVDPSGRRTFVALFRRVCTVLEVRANYPIGRSRSFSSARTARVVSELWLAMTYTRVLPCRSRNSADGYSSCGLDHPGTVDVIHDAFDPLPDHIETNG
jgi:hypothetical protein